MSFDPTEYTIEYFIEKFSADRESPPYITYEEIPFLNNIFSPIPLNYIASGVGALGKIGSDSIERFLTALEVERDLRDWGRKE